ncbi:MAG: hypothetical protein II304_00775 [Bacteroidales bacterium]|nr:hypothetical protein [Bacteroidales bacterium]
MNQEYYIGQIFEGKYPPEAAIWCNANQAYIDVIGDHRYEIKAIPPAPAPTKEEQQEKRHEAYVKEVDGLHAQKMRHEILGDWTEEDEAEYREKVIRLSEEIAERYPYPTDPIFEEGVAND